MMHARVSVFLCVFLFGAHPVGATPSTPRSGPLLGFQVGLNSAHYAFPRPEYLFLSQDHYKSRISYRLGPVAHLPTGRLTYLESGLLLSVKGEKIVDVPRFDMSGEWISTQHEKLYYLSLPLIAGVSLSDHGIRPRLFLGPEFNYLLAARWSSERGSDDMRSLYPSTEVALDLGAGATGRVAAHAVSLDLIYSWGLTNLNTSSNGNVHHFFNRVLSVSLGVWL